MVTDFIIDKLTGAKIYGMYRNGHMREIINQTDDFNTEPSEELDTFLKQFAKE